MSRDNKRRPGLIDENGIHLVDNGIVQIPKNHLLLVNGHVVPQVIKSQLIIRHIGNVAGIGFLSLLRGHGVEHHAYGQAQKLMDAAHPLRVTLGQIVVDRDDVDSLACQRV